MSEPDPSSNTPPPHTEHAATATTVRLPDFHSDSPQAWFYCIDAMFAAAKITSSLTKFNWGLSKLQFSLIDTIGLLCKHPSSYRDPYQELQDILLRSYDLSEMPAAPPLRSARRDLPATGLAAAVRPPRARPEAAAAPACASTTPALVPRLRSARRVALTRKTNSVLLPENLHTYFELSAQAWTLYKAPYWYARYPNSCLRRIKL
jgi:hypothetical protein